MSTTTFDTHRFASRLKEAGMSEEQAEAMIDAFRELNNGASLATKKDLALTAAEIKYDPLKWIIGLALAQFAFLVGIILRLPTAG